MDAISQSGFEQLQKQHLQETVQAQILEKRSPKAKTGLERLRERILAALPADKQYLQEQISATLQEENTPENQAKREEMHKQAREKARRQNSFMLAVERAGMSELLKYSLDNYSPEHRLQHSAHKAAKAFAQGWPEIGGRGIMLWGKQGTGKSHLLRGIGLGLMKQYPAPRVVYFYAPAIERVLRREEKLRKHYEGTGRTVSDTEEEIKRCDVLLLDDISKLGPGTSQGWLLNLVGCVIDQAERTGKPIICSTSNDDEATLRDEVFGAPFVSRLKKLMHWMEVCGPDHRESGEVPHWAQ